MDFGLFLTLAVPFLGTALGSGVVLGLPMGSERVRQGLNGFAGGAMLAALFWNLLLPGWGEDPRASCVGFALGIGLVLLAERTAEGRQNRWHPAAVLMGAVVLHNIPEGMAVGIGGSDATGTIVGIALQNIPDGAVAAAPLAAMGMKKGKAFAAGVLSGAVEPVAALIAMGLRSGAAFLAPGMMGFAAGAMAYVVIRELAPRMGEKQTGMVCFLLGFLLIQSMQGAT